MSIDAMKAVLDFLEQGNFVYPTKIADDLRAAITEAEKCERVACTCANFVTNEIGYMKAFTNLPYNTNLYPHPQPAIPAGYALVPVEPIKTGDPEISREHLVAIAEKCGLLGAYRTREVVDAIVGYGHVILRDKAVQEAMYRAALSAAPKNGDVDV